MLFGLLLVAAAATHTIERVFMLFMLFAIWSHHERCLSFSLSLALCRASISSRIFIEAQLNCLRRISFATRVYHNANIHTENRSTRALDNRYGDDDGHRELARANATQRRREAERVSERRHRNDVAHRTDDVVYRVWLSRNIFRRFFSFFFRNYVRL